MSQKSLLEDAASWTPAECQQRWEEALPKLTSHFCNADDYRIETDVLKLVCQSFLAVVPVEQSEEMIFSKISSKILLSFDGILESLGQAILQLQDEIQTAQENLASLLQVATDIVECLEMCVSHMVSGQGVLTMDSVHSLPSVVLPVVKSSYSHCKDSGSLYGECLGFVSDQLSVLFRKAHLLQMSFLSLVDKIQLTVDSSEKDIQEFCAICVGLHQVAQAVGSVDVKIMVTTWKHLSRLMCQQKEILKNYLDLPPMLRALTAAIMTDYQYVFELAPTIDENGLIQGSQSDEKAFSKSVKILGFQVKLLLMLVKEFDGYLGDSIPELYKLLLYLKSLMPPSLQAPNISSQHREEIQRHATVAVDPLIQHLISNPLFMESLTSTNTDFEKSLWLPRCLVQLQCLDAVPSLTESLQDQWMYMSRYSEDSPREPLINSVFTSLKHCSAELSIPVYIASSNHDGGPSQDVSLYHHAAVHLCAYVGACPTRHFSSLEQCLLEEVLCGDDLCAMLATDVWCFMARFGTADLCHQHCNILARLLGNLVSQDTHECCKLLALLRRLVKFMSPEHQAQFLADFPVEENMALWSSLSLTSFSPAILNQLAGCLVTVATKTIHQWVNASEWSYGLALDLARCLQSLYAVYQTPALVDSHISPQLQATIIDKCCHLWTYLPKDGATSQPILENFAKNLILVSSQLIPSFQDKDLIMMLATLDSVLNRGSAGDTIKVATLEYLQNLGKKKIPSQILVKLREIFTLLLSDTNPIVHVCALQAFAKFAEETPHEDVVTECLQMDQNIQDSFVAYLNKVPHLQDKGFNLQSHLEKQAQTLCRQDNLSPEELYPVPVAPPIVQERSDGPAAKRLRGDGCGDTEEKENVDEIISRVKSDIRILLDISQRQGLSAIAKQELLKIKGDLGSLALR